MTPEVLVRAGEVAVVAAALTLALLVVGHTVLHTRGGRRWVAVGAVLLVYAAMAVPGLAPLWFAAFPLVAATFPDGRLTPRWLALPLVVCVVLTALELASGGAWSDLPWWPWFAMSQVLLLVGPVVRYRRRATTAERVAVRWVLLGILLTLAGYAATQAAFGAIGTGGPGARLGASLAILPVMLGLAVGLVAPAAVDVDAALHAVTATLLAVGALTLVVLAVPAETWVRVVAVSLLGAPAALAARRAADWLVYRGRPDPQRAVDRMLARLSTPTGHDDAARVVLEAVVDAAYLAGGRISGDWFDAVETGTPGVAIRSRVDFRGEPLATLELAPRRGESDLTRRDRRVVAALVAQAAPSLEAARTLAALQESRTRVVAAREEERRRLRRELHDDLGPTLSGIALSASALATTTGSADAAELHREIRQAVARSRELAYGLRPPVLDDHGLVAAVHDRVGGPDLRLEAPEVLDLPAAVDLAALRITQEAVTNARRSRTRVHGPRPAAGGGGMPAPRRRRRRARAARGGPRGRGDARARRARGGGRRQRALRPHGPRVPAARGTAPGRTVTRVVVVDDHPVFRRGLVGMLRASGHEVVGQAANGLEAVEVVTDVLPEVVLMDLAMPDGDGFTATARIRAEHPDVAVVVVTLFSDEGSVRRALDAGATAYVGKHAEPEQIVAAVDAARDGGLWIGGGVERPGFGTPVAAPDLPGGLTPREVVIGDLLSRGLTNPMIAGRLGLSTKTVANYVSSVVLKLGADDRAHAGRIVRAHRGA